MASNWKLVQVLDETFFKSVGTGVWDTDHDLIINNTDCIAVFTSPATNYAEVQIALQGTGTEHLVLLELLADSDNVNGPKSWIEFAVVPAKGIFIHKFPYVGPIEALRIKTLNIGMVCKLKELNFVVPPTDIIKERKVSLATFSGIGWTDNLDGSFSKNLIASEVDALLFSAFLDTYCFVKVEALNFSTFNFVNIRYKSNGVNTTSNVSEWYLDLYEISPHNITFDISVPEFAQFKVTVFNSYFQSGISAFGGGAQVTPISLGAQSTGLPPGMGTAASHNDSEYLHALSNLAELNSAAQARVNLGIPLVENKSAAMINAELTPAQILAALGGALAIYATIASPTFTGVPLAPTAAPGTNTTQIASTAFVTNAVVAATTGVASFNTRVGAVILNIADINAATNNLTGTNPVITLKSTTVGALNQAGAKFDRADVAFGYAQLSYLTNAVIDWQVGTRAGDSAYHIYDAVGAIERMQISTAGNIGIGIVPTVRLHIQHDQNGASRILIGNITNGFAASSNVRCHYNNETQFSQIVQRNPGFTTVGIRVENSAEVSSNGNVNGLRILTFDNAPVIIGAQNIERVRYDPTKNTAQFTAFPSMPRMRSVHENGAVGDYNPVTQIGTDDGAAIQACMDSLYAQGGGVAILEPTKKYRYGRVLVIPVGVTLRGPYTSTHSGFRGAYTYTNPGFDPESLGGRAFRNIGGSLWCTFDAGRGNQTIPNATNPTGASNWTNDATYDVQQMAGLPNYPTRTASIYLAGTLEGCYIFTASYSNAMIAGATTIPTWNYGIATHPGYYAGLAIRQYAEYACIRNCFIGGFMQAYLDYLESGLKIENLDIDCINGIEISSCFNVAFIEKVNAFPYSAIGYSLSNLSRGGTFMWLHDGVDWAKITSCFTFGHKIGFYLLNVNGTQINNCSADRILQDSVGAYGLLNSTAAINTTVSNFKAASRQWGISSSPGAAESITLSGITTAACNTAIEIVNGNCTIHGGHYKGPGDPWSAAINYQIGDHTNSGGVVYRAILAHINQVPPNATYWVVATSKGFNNIGAGTVKAVNPTFNNYITNTSNTGGGVLTLL